MAFTAKTLQVPAHPVVVALAQGYLKDARKAVKALKKGPQNDALHDYRVALRKLKNLLEIFGEDISSRTSGKVLRRVKSAFAATGAYRDGEVIQNRLKQDKKLRQIVSWSRLLQLPDTGPSDSKKLRRKLIRRLDLTEKSLKKLFRETRKDKTNLSFGSLLDTKLGDRKACYDQQLQALDINDNFLSYHNLRITAKGLRYILEPFSNLWLEGSNVIAELEMLQNLLGDLHDDDILLEKIEAALTRRDLKPEETAALAELRSSVSNSRTHNCSRLLKALARGKISVLGERLPPLSLYQ